MATNGNTQEIKAKLREEVEVGNLYLDIMEEPMTLLENQISQVFSDLRKCPISSGRFITQTEKVMALVREWKKIGLIQMIYGNEIYANHFNFHEDLSDDDYHILAIKHIVKNNL